MFGAATAVASSTARGGLVVDQDGPQCGERAGIVTIPLEISERVPDRADHGAHLRSGGEPGQRLRRELLRPLLP